MVRHGSAQLPLKLTRPGLVMTKAWVETSPFETSIKLGGFSIVVREKFVPIKIKPLSHT